MISCKKLGLCGDKLKGQATKCLQRVPFPSHLTLYMLILFSKLSKMMPSSQPQQAPGEWIQLFHQQLDGADKDMQIFINLDTEIEITTSTSTSAPTPCMLHLFRSTDIMRIIIAAL